MGLLGDFLESFYGGGSMPRSIWAQVRHERLNAGRGPTSRRGTIGREKPRTKASQTVVEMEFWALLPDRVRVDATRVKDGVAESTVAVSKGRERLRRVEDGSVEVESEGRRGRRDGESLPNDYRRHFDRTLIRRFFTSLVLEKIGECQVAGRECVRMRATPTAVDQIWPHWLPTEADEFEFAADLEFPSLLSIRAKLAGETFEAFEVVDVAFNGEIDANVFEVRPLTGQQVRTSIPVVQPMSLAAAIAKVPFTVLLPTVGFAEFDPEIHYQPPRGQRKYEILVVSYREWSDKRFWYHLCPQPDTEMLKGLEWEDIEISGRTFRLSDPGTEDGLKVLAFTQEGTWVEIISDFDRDELLRVVESFAPVRS